ncbi:MAG TPA: GNAT family N-acetyltransferase [Solirubrobacteraceae bacterium]|nr:GNAT family N-acetyltransferase [Solirubrobacteraceae bacterium]
MARLKDGSEIELRPVEPDDGERIVSGFAGLSERSRYERFFTVVPTLPRHWLDELVDIDHRDREAIGAVDPQTGDGVGVARYVRLPEHPDEAEFAVTVTDAWQGRGVGRVLMNELLDAARANGIARLSGDVLAENEAMLALSRSLGAHVEPAESAVTHVVIEL